MDVTENLTLPYIAAAQAQKHVTHNEAIRALDALVHLSVVTRSLAAPPATPPAGARYVCASQSTDDWAGHDGEIAAYQDSAWRFYAPAIGWVAWVADESTLLAWDGGQWVVAGGTDISLNPATGDRVGVNTTADATNKLAVKSDAALFSHDDITPGSGDARLSINKAAVAQTASVVFQDNFSGRAEFGLIGDDTFQLKVSDDGATFRTALVIDQATGIARFPEGGVREQLTAARTYFVRAGGSDANSGLTETDALASPQAAINRIANLDLMGFVPTVDVGPGQFAGISIQRPLLGASRVVLRGAGPTATTLASATQTIFINAPVRLDIEDVAIEGATSAINVADGGKVIVNSGKTVRVGVSLATGRHIAIGRGAFFQAFGATIELASGGNWCILQSSGSESTIFNTTFKTLSAITFGSAFAQVASGVMNTNGNLIFDLAAGSVTGKRYYVLDLGLIKAGNGGPNMFPGTSAGTTATGGLYA